MKKADTLSCRLDHDIGKEDNKDRILLKKERFRILVIDKGELWKELEDAKEFIEEEVEAALKKGREGWRKEGKVILWKERAYVPDLDTFCKEVLKAHHDQELAGYSGYTKTHELITRNYWWPRLMDNVKQYVKGCEKCQVNKPNRLKKTNHLHLNEISNIP